jgi:hypothetical protein
MRWILLRSLYFLLVPSILLFSGCGASAPPTPTFVNPESDGKIPVPDEDTRGGSDTVDPDQVNPDIPSGPCVLDDDCDGYYCDTSTGECVECLITSQCPPGFKCFGMECVPEENGCVSDAECTVKGLICDEDKGICVECVDSADCPTGEYCLEVKCLDWVCTPEAKWCNGKVAMQCNEDGSAMALEMNCDDGDVCTIGDSCVNGECAQSSPKDCDDGNVCTIDDCNPESGCYYQFNEDPCEDGTDCTTDDVCKEGVCEPGELVCDCLNDGDCLDKEDGDFCNGILTCKNGYCVINPDTVVSCNESDDPCLTISCDPGTGNCLDENAPDDDDCDDDSACTEDDACQDGECVGNPADCDDGNACTADDCDAELGCLHEPLNGTDCDDGNKCTYPDNCIDGICIGTKMDCEDGNPCTKNTCLPALGCQSEELTGACEDGDACTGGDTCIEVVCVGEPVVCVDDNNPCTNDYCDPDAGCVNEPNDLPCDDDNGCTTNDHCQAGECVPGELLIDCQDDNPCTIDSCNVETGACIFIPNTQPCDDGDLCTEGDICADSICVSGQPKNCDDENLCTEDACNELGTCVQTPIAGSCEDGNACTTNDTCQGGACQPGQPLKCNDSNTCTDDSCDPQEGCVHAPNMQACNDGDACTLADACTDGVCQGGSILDCEDNNPCTDDSCDSDAGCLNVPNQNACEDGNACTENDTCAASICIPGGQLVCDDINPCTDDSCDENLGCQYDPNNDACEDGDACTFNDACADGDCKAGDLNDCDDSNPCTDDICDFTTCKHPPIDGVCDDLDPCTVTDMCTGGTCLGSSVANCGCYSVKLDGTSGYGRVANNNALNPAGDFTIELWMKQSPAVIVPGAQYLLSRWLWTGKTDEQAFELFLNAANKLVFQMKPAQGNQQVKFKAVLEANQEWHHVAVVYDGEQLRFYVDGSLKTTTESDSGISTSTVPLLLGAAWDTNTSVANGFFSGWMDEVRMSSAALYTGDEFEPATTLSVLDSTIAYWGANQNQFNSVFDQSAHYLHALLIGNTQWSTDTPSTVCTPVPDYPPSQPQISISPPNPSAAVDLTCQIDVESQDMENDPVTYTYLWYKNGQHQPQYTDSVLPSAATTACPDWQCSQCEKWSCLAIPWDGPMPGMWAFTSATIGLQQCKDCPGQVWNNHCYWFTNNQVDWGQAHKGCGDQGATLVTINNESENGYIDGLCGDSCWVGLNDVAGEGKYLWDDGSGLSGYDNWRWNEPNNGGLFGNQDCVAMCQNCGWNAPSGLWQTEECDDTRPYICEMLP